MVELTERRPPAMLVRIAGHRAVWPLLALAVIILVSGFLSPGFYNIRIVEGRLFGNLIDILYRAVPTALVALGMAVVIGTLAGLTERGARIHERHGGAANQCHTDRTADSIVVLHQVTSLLTGNVCLRFPGTN
jgi:hypothetical protein